MPILLIKILLEYPTVFLILKFKLLGSIKMFVPTEKFTFDTACSKEALIDFNINGNRIVFIYQCIQYALKDLLSIHCRRRITYYTPVQI